MYNSVYAWHAHPVLKSLGVNLVQILVGWSTPVRGSTGGGLESTKADRVVTGWHWASTPTICETTIPGTVGAELGPATTTDRTK